MTTDAQAEYLTVLNRAEAGEVKAFVEGLLPELERAGLEVLENRTGLVMLPGTDTAWGAGFHLGEVLVSEARVRLAGAEGYTVCLGRDLEQALAVALLDAALRAGLGGEAVRAFVTRQAEAQRRQDALLARRVEGTRVEMETF